MSAFPFAQYVPQSNLILDSTTGQFRDRSEFLDSGGNLIPPPGYSFITGVVLEDPQPLIPQPMPISIPSLSYANPSMYYPPISVPVSYGYVELPSVQTVSMQAMCIPSPATRIMQHPTQVNMNNNINNNYSPQMQHHPNTFHQHLQQNQIEEISSAAEVMYETTNLNMTTTTNTPQSFLEMDEILSEKNNIQEKIQPEGYGEKQKVIPEVYDFIKTEFTKKNVFVVNRTIDEIGATFRVCAKSLGSLLALPRILFHLDQELSILEVSIHVMTRRKKYRKGLTCYVKIGEKKDINRALDIADLYGQKFTIVSTGDEDTRGPAPEIKILYRTDSDPSGLGLLSPIVDEGDDELGLEAPPMMKKTSSILTVRLPDASIVNLNVEGIEPEDTDSDIENEISPPCLDKQSSLTLQLTISKSRSDDDNKKKDLVEEKEDLVEEKEDGEDEGEEEKENKKIGKEVVVKSSKKKKSKEEIFRSLEKMPMNGKRSVI